MPKIQNNNNIINIEEAKFYNNTVLINEQSGTGKFAPIFTIDNVIKLINEGLEKTITSIKTSLFIPSTPASITNNSNTVVEKYEYKVVKGSDVKFYFTIGTWDFTVDDTLIMREVYKLANIDKHEFVCFFMELELVSKEKVNVLLWTFGWGYCSGPNCKKIPQSTSLLPGTDYVGEFTFPDKYTSQLCFLPTALSKERILKEKWDMNITGTPALRFLYLEPDKVQNVIIFLERIIKCNFYINGDVREDINKEHMKFHNIGKLFLTDPAYASAPLPRVYYFRPSNLKYNIARHVCPFVSSKTKTAACIHIPKTIIDYIMTKEELGITLRNIGPRSLDIPKRENLLLDILDQMYLTYEANKCRPKKVEGLDGKIVEGMKKVSRKKRKKKEKKKKKKTKKKKKK